MEVPDENQPALRPGVPVVPHSEPFPFPGEDKDVWLRDASVENNDFCFEAWGKLYLIDYIEKNLNIDLSF